MRALIQERLGLLHGDWVLRCAAISAAVVALHATSVALPLPITAVAGLYLLLLCPSLLLLQRIRWGTERIFTRYLLCFGATLLCVMVLSAAWSQVGLALGVARPLDRQAHLMVWVVFLVCLASWRATTAHHARGAALSAARRRHLTVVEQVLTSLSLLYVTLSVLGAIRLNNGRSGLVATVALATMVYLLVVMWFFRHSVSEGQLLLLLYFVALGLLLSTSLRGWELSGHDIQREFRVFLLTLDSGQWIQTQPADPYASCLSVTTLPAAIANFTSLPPESVFRVLFQSVFALVAPLMYHMARLLVPSRGQALAAAEIFILFPTFVTDMPYLNRQEVAFLFVGLVFLSSREVTSHRPERVLGPGRATGRGRALADVLTPDRRIAWPLAMAVGGMVSHYSTNYVLVATIVIAALTTLWRFLPRHRVNHGRPPVLLSASFIGLMVLVTLAWAGPLTHTGGQLFITGKDSLSQILSGGGTASSDVQYSIWPRQAPVSPQERLDDFRQETIRDTQADRDLEFLPLSLVDQYPTTALTKPQMPLTDLGGLLSRGPIDLPSSLALGRVGFAFLLQLLAVVGLTAAALGRGSLEGFPKELVYVGWASMGLIGLQLIVPALSVEYGVLRAFQQALLVLAPLIAAGAAVVGQAVGQRGAKHAPGLLAIGLVFTMSGILPQMLGGGPPTLSLNNRGLYYDAYYTHPGEIAALKWLDAPARDHQIAVQAEAFTVRLSPMFADPARGVMSRETMYPTQIRKDSYVLLGSTTVERGTSLLFISGDLVSYTYPEELLTRSKNLVYSNGDARIYK